MFLVHRQGPGQGRTAARSCSTATAASTSASRRPSTRRDFVLARAGRRRRRGQPARRRRVRRGLAPGRHARPQAERLRRLHRRAPSGWSRSGYTAPREAGHPGRQQRRPAGRRRDDAAARTCSGAVVCQVPVADMLRYHLFTVGRFWIPEYGSADDPEQFPFLLRLLAVPQRARTATAYPATLITTRRHRRPRVARHGQEVRRAACRRRTGGDAPHPAAGGDARRATAPASRSRSRSTSRPTSTASSPGGLGSARSYRLPTQ